MSTRGIPAYWGLTTVSETGGAEAISVGSREKRNMTTAASVMALAKAISRLNCRARLKGR
jgi:hypothetical protein